MNDPTSVCVCRKEEESCEVDYGETSSAVLIYVYDVYVTQPFFENSQLFTLCSTADVSGPNVGTKS